MPPLVTAPSPRAGHPRGRAWQPRRSAPWPAESMPIIGAGARAQMIQMKYGRDQELEQRHEVHEAHRLRPEGAVTLQETFVRLFSNAEKDRTSRTIRLTSAVSAWNRTRRPLKSSEPASRKEIYIAEVRPFSLDMKPAYDKYDEALVAAQKGDNAKARAWQ